MFFTSSVFCFLLYGSTSIIAKLIPLSKGGGPMRSETEHWRGILDTTKGVSYKQRLY